MNKFAQEHLTAVYTKISQFHAEDAYWDIELHVEDKVFRCHQIILAAASPYFHTVFTSLGREEGAALPEVVVPQVEEKTFEQVLKFVYGGEMEITSSTVYNLARASNTLQIRGIEDACVEFIRGKFVGPPLADAMKLFSMARMNGRTTLANLLGVYIHKNFDYYSKLPQVFVSMKPHDLLAILDLLPDFSSLPQDVFMFAIIKWIRDARLSARDRKFWFDRFMRRIKFARLSAACIEFITRLTFEDFLVLRELSEVQDDPPPHSLCDPSEYESEQVPACVRDYTQLHVYVNTYSEDEEFGTRVFALYSQFNEEKWVQSCMLDCTESPAFMRSLILNERIYYLSFRGKPNSDEKVEGVQTFRVCTSISLFTDTFLNLPPLTLDKYDMCGHDENIFVYGKNTLSASVSNETCTTFDKEQLNGGVYRFNRFVNLWSPLPAPKHKYANACMTCDGPVVYLIGGTNSNKFVQCYDIRTPAWTGIAHTIGVFENAACCTLDGKIFVSGGTRHYKGVEMYDPRAAKWEKMAAMRQGRSDHQLIPLSRSQPHLVTGGRVLSGESDLEILNVAENKWTYAVQLYKPAMNGSTTTRKSFKVVDMITYKPYGL